MTKQIEISDSTDERLQELKLELFGADLEDESFIYLLCDEILNEPVN